MEDYYMQGHSLEEAFIYFKKKGWTEEDIRLKLKELHHFIRKNYKTYHKSVDKLAKAIHINYRRGIPIDEIIRHAKEKGWSEASIKHAISKLKDANKIPR